MKKGYDDMKDYLNEINERFPIRRRTSEKAALYDYVCKELGHESVKKEVLEKKHANIIIGEIESAKVVFTAHYDTPARSLVPNLMLPANKIKCTIFHILYPLILALISILVAFGIGAMLSLDDRACIIIYLVLYFGAFYCATRLFTNKNNKNDNTSGVATVLTLAQRIISDDVAFVLFDNEELGLLGSKALNKQLKAQFESKMVVNLDCVGNGDQIIVVPKPNAEKLPEYALLQEVLTPERGFEVHYVPYKKAHANSDYKNFPCGIGVMACKKGRIVKFYTTGIHTDKDTVASSENIRYLADKFEQFVDKIQKKVNKSLQ